MLSVTYQVWTKNLTSGTTTITAAFGFQRISILLVSGTASITGSLTANGIGSDALDLTVGTPVTITTVDGYLIDGLQITASGLVQVIGR